MKVLATENDFLVGGWKQSLKQIPVKELGKSCILRLHFKLNLRWFVFKDAALEARLPLFAVRIPPRQRGTGRASQRGSRARTRRICHVLIRFISMSCISHRSFHNDQLFSSRSGNLLILQWSRTSRWRKLSARFPKRRPKRPAQREAFQAGRSKRGGPSGVL